MLPGTWGGARLNSHTQHQEGQAKLASCCMGAARACAGGRARARAAAPLACRLPSALRGPKWCYVWAGGSAWGAGCLGGWANVTPLAWGPGPCSMQNVAHGPQLALHTLGPTACVRAGWRKAVVWWAAKDGLGWWLGRHELLALPERAWGPAPARVVRVCRWPAWSPCAPCTPPSLTTQSLHV